jgi:hypothetical protein
MDGWHMSEQFKNSPSLKWMADELGVSTAVAYRLTVAFNFATLVTLIVIPSRSKLPAIFRDRTELIRQTLEDAQRASTEAKKRLVAIESRFAKLGSRSWLFKGAPTRSGRWRRIASALPLQKTNAGLRKAWKRRLRWP